MTKLSPSMIRRPFGSLALSLICAGGLLAGLAAAPAAHASPVRIHQGSSMHIAQGVICHDCGRYGPFAHFHPDPNGHPWSTRPRIVPDPTCPTCLHNPFGAGHAAIQPAVNPQPLPPGGRD